MSLGKHQDWKRRKKWTATKFATVMRLALTLNHNDVELTDATRAEVWKRWNGRGGCSGLGSANFYFFDLR